MSSEQAETSPILIIVGMHRSGTSLVTSLLQQAGLFVGHRLMPPSDGNRKGHFENLDFYELHQAILRSQGISEEGWTLQEQIDVDDIYIEEAKRVVAQNTVLSSWGWKDPRTALFLNFWADLLPDANFLMVYRSPWDVIQSLYRRGDPIFQQQPDLAVKIWLHYNKKIIDFHHQYPTRTLLVGVQAVTNYSFTLIETINQAFGLTLTSSVENPYDPALMHNQAEDYRRPSLVKHYFPEAIDLYEALELAAWRPADTPVDCSWRDRLTPTFYKVWAFQDWLANCNLERENRALRSALEHTQTQLQSTQNTLESTQAQLQQAQAELAQTKEVLQQMQQQVDFTQLQSQQVQHLKHVDTNAAT